MKEIRLDEQRFERIGQPELIYGASKTKDQLHNILQQRRSQNKNSLVTKLSPEQAAPLLENFNGLHYDNEAQTLSDMLTEADQRNGKITLICAGTSDVPILKEAQRTADYLGIRTHAICDVGVAGIHRLMETLPECDDSDVIICFAGFEGALPSVLAGLVKQPVIGVPTSVGYGVSAGGVAAFQAMLSSCAQGLMVMNIDNGCGAVLASSRILTQIYK